MVAVLGPRDEFLEIVERGFDADVHVRGNEITSPASRPRSPSSSGCSTSSSTIVRTGQGLTARRSSAPSRCCGRRPKERPADVLTLNILSNRGRTIRPKTLNQKRYVDAIDAHTVVFGIGPAGTGKTYLAMAKAVQALQAKQVNRIILTRPAVEAGERLGYLPGTLSEKIDPYLRPLYDALHDMLDPETIPKLLTAGTIEVAPLAYMRGRTLNDAFIILDEAQNTSPEQMKMFLTRLGFGSRMVVTGDVTQVDLPSGTKSGLRVVQEILDGIHDISFCRLTAHDVVRHKLVGKIVAAYDRTRPASSAARAGASSAAIRPRRRIVRAAMSVEVLNESGVDARRRAVRPAGPVHDPPDARPPAGRAVPQARRRADDGRVQRTVHGQGAVPPTCSRSRWTSCGRAARMSPSRRACSATCCSARSTRRRRRRSSRGHRTTRCTC